MRLFSGPLNMAASFGCSAASAVADGTQTVLGEEVKPSPDSMRALLLSMEGSVHGRILPILGRTEAERVETIARFLAGTDKAEMNELLRLLQLAIAENAASIRTT